MEDIDKKSFDVIKQITIYVRNKSFLSKEQEEPKILISTMVQ